MNCACVYVDTEYAAEVESRKIVRARKPHKCFECGCEIKIGEQYERSAGIWDGEVQTYKTCLDCLQLRDEFFCDGWTYGDIHEDLRNHIEELEGEISSECILAVTRPRARDILFQFIEEVWRDLNDLEDDEEISGPTPHISVESPG